MSHTKDIPLQDDLIYLKGDDGLVGKTLVFEYPQEIWDEEERCFIDWYGRSVAECPYTGAGLTVIKVEAGVIYLEGSAGFKYRLAFCD